MDQFLANVESFEALLGTLGRSPADVEIIQATGSNPQDSEVVIVQAFRVEGVETAALLNAFVEWRGLGAESDVATPTTIAGKQLVVVGSPNAEPQFKSYYYGYGDVVFRLGYNGPDFDERMAEIVSELP